MLKLQKALGPKGNVLRKEYERSVKDKAIKMKLLKDKDEKLTIENAQYTFFDYYMDNKDKFNTEKDVDRYIKSNKYKTTKNIKEAIKDIEQILNMWNHLIN
jgi:hypothetical protein